MIWKWDNWNGMNTLILGEGHFGHVYKWDGKTKTSKLAHIIEAFIYYERHNEQQKIL
jgi:hypothetical protein